MRHLVGGITPTRHWVRLLPAVLLLLACGTTGTIGGTSPTATTRPTATPAGPPPHAFAWTQYDAHSIPQIWASVNGAAPVQVTHLPPPPPSDIGCGTSVVWSPPVFSPDLRHIVAGTGSSNCGDGPLSGPLDVIDVASGAVTPVPGGDQVRTTQRSAGWIDNSTIYWANASGLQTYTLGAGSASALPGTYAAEEVVLRGSTLFYLHLEGLVGASLTWTESLHRYDIATHTAIGTPIALGQYRMCACSPGDYHTAGWDVSPDGTHIAYQFMVPLTGVEKGLASSQIMYANADGSGATHIAQTLDATDVVRIQFAPNGRLIAIADGEPSPVTVSASVSSPGAPGDPSYHQYTPATVAFPVWKWDSSQFWAGTAVYGWYGSPSAALYNFTVGSPAGVVGVSGGYNPWYTIGH
jgi:hypothetical protein